MASEPSVHEQPLFSVDVSHLDGSVTVVLIGAFDLAGSELFEAKVWPLVSRYDARQVVLDCGRLTSIDLVGCHQLVRLAKRCGDGAGKITLSQAPPSVGRLLSCLGSQRDLFEVQVTDAR